MMIWCAMGIEAGMSSRDFMLPWPNRELTGFVRKVVDYPIASTTLIFQKSLFRG